MKYFLTVPWYQCTIERVEGWPSDYNDSYLWFEVDCVYANRSTTIILSMEHGLVLVYGERELA